MTRILAAVVSILLFAGACTTQTQQSTHDANRTLYDVNRTLNNIRALEYNLGRL